MQYFMLWRNRCAIISGFFVYMAFISWKTPYFKRFFVYMAPAIRQPPYLDSFSQILARACRPILAFLIFYCRIPKFFRLSVCISFCSRHFFLKSFCIWHFLKGPRHVYRNQAKIWRGVNHRHILILFLPGLLPYMNLPD